MFFFLLLPLLFISGCSIKKPDTKETKCCQKVFEKEDFYIMSALYFQQKGYYQDAAELFKELYKKTERPEYKIEEIKLLIAMKKYKSAKEEILKLQKSFPDNAQLFRLLSLVYFHLKDYKNAEKSILKAIKLKSNPQDYEFLASMYMSQKKYEAALKYYQSAYAINHDEKLVDRMATIMFLYLNKKKDAIAYLETHTRMYGCSFVLCNKLASFYGALNDVDGMISVYKRMYERYNEDDIAKKLVELYIFKRDYKNAIEFLEKSKFNDELLLDLYKIQKDYKKAAKLSETLYKKTGDLDYLAQNAIFEYESASDKNDPTLLNNVIKKFEKVLEKREDSLYLNYLGYLLIDHDINIKRGIELVKKALKQNSESPYYLDSLAWGYYKLGRCKEAYELMKKVIDKLGLKDKEVKIHWEKIEECLNKITKKQ
ncbi:tetratricopeptide repeat protein [Nitrosophilus alvini]|uniref:tetratricopeptide repeat protein n=1 Tax=Nitrosophilus alvini TaxID=2714855 RepID=UPI00190C3D44|nr:tetratricopeptide repeat protein [Nitrosophilus alvini]